MTKSSNPDHGSNCPKPLGWQATRRLTTSIPGNCLKELRREGSLTRRIQVLSGHKVQVRILFEGYARPTRDEALALALPPRQQTWIREVALCAGQTPWVLARTIMPLATLRGSDRYLQHLGRKPLGALLFAKSCWRRGVFELSSCLTPEQHTQSSCARDQGPAKADQPPARWQTWYGRRSLFRKRQHGLLVSEFFCPVFFQPRYTQGSTADGDQNICTENTPITLA